MDQTTEQQALACLKYLAGMDADHATELNGVGFNGTDTGFGHSLAEQSHLSQKQLFRATELLQKYRRQLERAGLTCPPVVPLPTVNDYRQPQPQAQPQYASNWANGPDYPDIIAKSVDRAPLPKPPPAQPRTVAPRVRLAGDQAALSFGSWPGEQAIANCKMILKKFKGQGFKSDTKEWLFNTSAVPALVLAFPTAQWPPELRETAEHEAALARSAESAAQEVTNRRVAKAMQAIDAYHYTTGITLYDYQAEDILKACAPKHHGTGLFYRRGAGKTLPALLAAKAWGCTALVLTTNSAMENWRREAAGAQTEIKVFNWASQPDPATIDYPFVLIADEVHKSQTYAYWEKDKQGQKLTNEDGSPRIKGSMRTWNFLQLTRLENCQTVLALTGTPFPNGRARELFATLEAIQHPVAESRWQYEHRYCAAGKDGWGHYHNDGMQHADELRTLLLDSCMFRGKAKAKPLDREVVLVEPTEERVAEHDRTMRELFERHEERLESGEIEEGGEALVETGIMRHAASRAKIEPAVALTHELVAGGEKVLLFTQFIDVADEIVAGLNQDFVSPFDGESVACRCGQITGSVDGKKRQPIVDQLTKGEIQTLVNVFGSAQEALNIQAASTVILVDRTWVPGDADQAEGRIDRAGQTQDTHSIWLQYGPIDAKIDNVLIAKVEAINKVTRGERKTMRGFKESTPGRLAALTLQAIFEDGEVKDADTD